jgi:hypothetical protein
MLLIALLPTMVRSEPGAPIQQDLNTITVLGSKDTLILRREIDHFVGQVIKIPFEGALARWRTPVCPLVGGLSRDMGEYMLGKLSSFAREAKVPLAGKNCKANFYLILTARPEDLIKAWSRREPGIFAEADHFSVGQFVQTEAPIRAWYNLALESTDGGAITTSSAALSVTGTHADGGAALQGVPTLAAHASRLRWNAAHDLASVIILVDTRRTAGITYGQLAAYAAMQGFVQVRKKISENEAPTILTLFDADPTLGQSGLSVWDEALLKALYATEQSDKLQVYAIKRSIEHEVLAVGALPRSMRGPR